ncbi:MAG: hypothetical protein AMJ69_04530 [Gammaproteobacteria bacterium SG8_47]|nr:MAG: hypothetical protein AMJ69_04530 [Gammaproteobacteria bacterium SG8_47]
MAFAQSLVRQSAFVGLASRSTNVGLMMMTSSPTNAAVGRGWGTGLRHGTMWRRETLEYLKLQTALILVL